MRIVVNGDERVVTTNLTVRELLMLLEVKSKAVAVERNLEIVPAAFYGECTLNEGDRLEIVTLVGGG